MNQQKGFSLIEVLASLLLISTLALGLLQQQWQGKYLLNQLILNRQSTQFLDQIEEALIAQVENLKPICSSYYQFPFNPRTIKLRNKLSLSELYPTICPQESRFDKKKETAHEKTCRD